MHVKRRMVGAVGALALAATGAVMAAPTAQAGSWESFKDRQRKDNDAGGVSGTVERYWSGDPANTFAYFNFRAYSERFRASNETDTTASYGVFKNGKLIHYFELSPGEKWYKDDKIEENQHIAIIVSVANRGSAQIDTLMS